LKNWLKIYGFKTRFSTSSIGIVDILAIFPNHLSILKKFPVHPPSKYTQLEQEMIDGWDQVRWIALAESINFGNHLHFSNSNPSSTVPV